MTSFTRLEVQFNCMGYFKFDVLLFENKVSGLFLRYKKITPLSKNAEI